VNDQLISNIESYFKKIYKNQDVVSITIANPKCNDIQIRGYKHNEIKNKVIIILEKIKSYKIPNNWDNILDLINNADPWMII
jgi:hypothetical protein